MLLKSNCIIVDYSKAKEYYELAAKQNNSKALFKLGLFHEEGKGVQKNYYKSIEYYELSAKQNNPKALFK